MTDRDPPDSPIPLEMLIARILAAERAGDLLQAADLAAAGLDRHPDSHELQYREILDLARVGGLDRAERLWRERRLPAADVRFASLGARLLRDRAWREDGATRGPALAQAAKAYAAIFAATGESFPASNAAALFAIAGDSDRAAGIARKILAAAGAAATGSDSFNRAADIATAAFVLADRSAGETAITTMLANADNRAAIASARRHLRQLSEATGFGADLVERLRAKLALHFTGHRIEAPDRRGRFPAAAEAAVAAEIETALDRLDVGVGFGSLAAGGDILVAEALQRRGIPVHVVLPFDRDAFVAHSVAGAGTPWVRRFEAVLARAQSVTQATEGPYLGDAAVHGYAAQLAMGAARLDARIGEGECRQLAVWDGQAASGPAGAAHDVELWRRLGLPATIVSSRPDGEPPASVATAAAVPRRVCAILFGDFKGYGGLNETQLLAFNREVLPHVAATIDRHGAHVRVRNSWGDGLFLVFDDVGIGAACALELQATIARLHAQGLPLPDEFGLRLAIHAGPVFLVDDPVIGRPSITGRHVTRTARIEPIVPEGEVYVSEAMAASLALRSRFDAAYEYVGRLPLAKQAGHLRLYLLRGGRSPLPEADRSFDPWAQS